MTPNDVARVQWTLCQYTVADTARVLKLSFLDVCDVIERHRLKVYRREREPARDAA